MCFFLSRTEEKKNPKMNLSSLSDQCEHILENFFPFFSLFFNSGSVRALLVYMLGRSKTNEILKANPKGKLSFTMSLKIGSVDKIIVLRQVNLFGFADFF